MPCPIALSNAIVMNKYIWMCRNLRNFNDVSSIINWVYAMASVKNLLLDPPPASLFPAVPQQSSLHPSHHQFLSTSNQQRPHRDLSISRPTTTTFLPSKRKPLTQSPLRCSTYEPSIASPLSTYTLCEPNISPTDSLPRCPKRRKIAIPPSVDYHAPTTPQPFTLKTQAKQIINEEQIQHTVWQILDWYNERMRLHFERDRQVPSWVQEEAEKRLKLPKNKLDPCKGIILQTITKYYNQHGKRPLEWIAI